VTEDLAQHRRECEARTWIRAGYINDSKLLELRLTLGKHRRPEAVEQVVEEMRRQWQRRREWME